MTTDRDYCSCEEPGHIKAGGICMDCGGKVGRAAAPINDGGPAFPDPGRAQSVKQRERLHYGMTLRDWFAGKAMQGAFTGPPIPCTADEHAYIAMHAYRMADAMLAAREK